MWDDANAPGERKHHARVLVCYLFSEFDQTFRRPFGVNNSRLRFTLDRIEKVLPVLIVHKYYDTMLILWWNKKCH